MPGDNVVLADNSKETTSETPQDQTSRAANEKMLGDSRSMTVQSGSPDEGTVRAGSDMTGSDTTGSDATGSDATGADNTLSGSKSTDSPVLPEVSIQNDKPANPEEAQRLHFLQQQLINIYPLYQPRDNNATPEDIETRNKQGVDQLNQEAREGKFGPATRKAYQDMVTWLERSAVPGAITELSRLSLPLPPGTPLPLPADAQGRLSEPGYYRELVASGRLKPELGLKPDSIPGDREVEKIDDVMRWLKEVDGSARTARERLQDDILEREIKKIVTDPEQQQAWLDKRNSNPREWRAAAMEAVDLATRVGRYIEAMDGLNRAGHRFGFSLPEGAEVVRDDKGKITSVKLDLPDDLRLGHPENAEKMENLKRWMADHGEQIDQAVREVIELEKNPDRLLFWGEVEVPGGLVKLDEKGEISQFVDRQDADGSETELNLAAMEFDVEEITVNGKKKIVVSNSVQYQHSNWYNYLNIGADDVGSRIDVGKREYDPEDWVPIRNGGKVEIVQAKDLADWRLKQQVFHYGEKALVATLDGAMLVTGTIGVAGAVKAAQAGRLVMSQALKQGLKGALRATVGASGIVNSAYWSESETGRGIQTARGLYFVGEAALGLGGGGMRLINRMRGVEGVGNSAHAVVEAEINASRWASTYRYADKAATLTMYPFAYLITADIGHQIETLNDLGKGNPLHTAMRRAQDGQGDHAPEGTSEPAIDNTKVQNIELDNYESLLAGDKINPEIKEILDRTRRLIEENASQDEKQTYIRTLMDRFLPNGDAIVAEEKNGTFEKDRQDRHTAYADTQDRAVQTAAALAILQLNRGQDGALPETLGSREVDVPSYEYTETEYGFESSYEVTRTKPARKESQELKTSDIAAFLRRELESPKPESRLVASSDLALQLGVASGREVAGVLQDVIASDTTSQTEKVQAVLRLGAVADALKVQEQAQAQSMTPEETFKDESRRVGLTSSAIEAYLGNVARQGGNQDLRAAAALMLQAGAESAPADRQALFSQYARKLAENQGTEGAFSRYAVDTLSTAMTDSNKTGDQRLVAASSLLDLVGPEGGATAYEAIANLVDSKNVDLSRRAIELLSPEGLALLDKENPQLATRAREQGIQIIKDTAARVRDGSLSYADEAQRSAFFNAILPLVKDGTQLQKSQTDLLLRGFIDPASDSFADISPKLRRASISALSDLGSRGALEVIRERLTGSPDKGIERDWDAGVRYEALKALENMKDPMLRPTVLGLLDKETDPAVSGLLREVRFSQERLDPTSEEYKRRYQETAASLMHDPFEGWDNLKAQVDAYRANLPQASKDQALSLFIRKWRNDNYWMLDGVEFNRYRDKKGQEAADGVYSGVGGFFSWVFSSGSTVRAEENKARNAERQRITDRRDGDFQDLIEKASLRSAEGMKAKMALVDILVNGGQPFADSESAWAQQKVAGAIRDMARPGQENRDYIVWAIETGLTSGPGMDPTARRYLLEGLVNLAKESGNGGTAVSREEAAMIAARALDLQNNQRAPYQPDPTIQGQLVQLLGQYKHHRTYPVLEALAAERRGTALGDQALSVLADLRDSVNVVWQDTAADHTTTPADRSSNLRSVLGDNKDTQITVEAIMASVKGMPITGRDDPRLAMLQIALNDSNPRVRLAASYVLLQGADPSTFDLSAVRKSLEEMRDHGGQAGYRRDAVEQLRLLEAK